MTLHKEGKSTILISMAITVLFTILISYTSLCFLIKLPLYIILIVLFLIIIYFFRKPTRLFTCNDADIICPADGKVVVIEEVFEKEFLKEKCIQVSVFMSPFNVHINWYPVKGKILFYRYHPGKKLVAWHPKSSEENERNTIVIETSQKQKILVRQIAGALARRICNYTTEGSEVEQGKELGFIKFGSRVDIFIPCDSKILVEIGQKVNGLQTVIAQFK